MVNLLIGCIKRWNPSVSWRSYLPSSWLSNLINRLNSGCGGERVQLVNSCDWTLYFPPQHTLVTSQNLQSPLSLPNSGKVSLLSCLPCVCLVTSESQSSLKVSKPTLAKGWKYVLLGVVDTCEESLPPPACMKQLPTVTAAVCEKGDNSKPAPQIK